MKSIMPIDDVLNGRTFNYNWDITNKYAIIFKNDHWTY